MQEKPSILIVDDDVNVRKTLAGILAKKGFDTDTAGSGSEALEKARDKFFNLALLDLRLPDKPGIDLIGPLKELHPDTEMIVATGYSSMETAVQALNQGASAYITKPLDMDSVLSTVQNILDRQHLVLENKRLLKEAQHELTERKKVESQRDATLAELERRTEELGLLYKAGHQLGRTLDLQEIYQVLYDVVSSVMACDSMVLSSFDPKKEIIRCVCNWHEGNPQDVSHFPSIPLEPEGLGIQSRVIRNGEPLLINDYIKEIQKVKTAYYIDEGGDVHNTIPDDSEQTRSAILVPIKLEGSVIGVVQVLSYKKDAFIQDNLKFLEAITLQVAAASNNAVLYQQAQTEIAERQRAEKEIQHRASMLETLNAIIALAAAAPDLDTLLKTALDHTLQALDLETGYIWVSDHVIIRNIPPDMLQEIIQDFSIDIFNITFNFVIEDWREHQGIMSELKSLVDRFGIRASITVPIFVKEKVASGLSISSPVPRKWEKEEIALVEAIGQQVGMAADRIYLLDRTRDQAQQLQETVNTVPEGVLLLDAQGRVVLANPVAQECLRVLAKEGIGQVLSYLGEYPLEDLLHPPLPGKWHEIEIKGPPQRIFELVARPVEKDQDPTEYVVLLREVTKEREINQYNQQQERLAAVGQLAAGIAHDFNNIMAVIMLYSQIALRNPDLSAKLKENLATISEQSKQASDLIQQILDYSRRSVLELRPLDLMPLLKELTKMLRRTLPENIQIRFSATDDSFTINADPTRIQQTIMNLAVNARDAMPNGGKLLIELYRLSVKEGEIQPLPDMKGGEWIRLSVTDSGGGIPESALPHIFEPFFTTKTRGKGTGLGLAQVYGIVKQHNGFINVQSLEGKQTTFNIYLPALIVGKPATDVLLLSELARGNGEKILVVEDNPATRRAVVDSLKQFDFMVLEAGNGKEALEIIETENGVALVLTDLVMPVMSGKELAEQLLIQKPDLKVLFMSGYSDAAIIRGGKVVKGAAFLSKPFSMDNLIGKIRELLDN
ncbi:MAG: response regulator [Anaerolineales bacterium]|nr:response regulator [Anaerolineales bacterium]